MSKENQRNSYTITIRASVDDINTIELIDYLKAIGRPAASKKIEDLLMVGLLALAKKHSGKYTAEQLTISCLESCNNFSNYASFLRQAFGVIDPQLQSNLLNAGIVPQAQLNNGSSSHGAVNGFNTASAAPVDPTPVQSSAIPTVAREPITNFQQSPEEYLSDEDIEDDSDEIDDEPDFDEVFGD